MNAKSVSNRYSIDMSSAEHLLKQIEQRYEMDWSEMEWRDIDVRFALTAWRASIGAPIDHYLTQNAIHILNWFEQEYVK